MYDEIIDKVKGMINKAEPERVNQLILLLKWEGQFGNARLRELFDIQVGRASKLIREFREEHPKWTELNTATKTYAATYQFYQAHVNEHETSLNRYLSLAGISPANNNENNSPIVSAFPQITTPNPKYFSMLSMATKLGVDVEIKYSSMNEPEPHSRIISPHSIVKAGPRWHVRAYSELNKQFRDYNLGRITDVKLLEQKSKFSIKDDKDWLTQVNVRLVAHPDLSYEQGTVVRLEYFAKTSARVTSCRAPLVNYFIKEMGAAIDIKVQRPPEYMLAVGNVEEISKWLFPK